MELDLLTAISPIDGRYRGKAEALADYFSEYALIKYRVQVEVEYFITLCEFLCHNSKESTKVYLKLCVLSIVTFLKQMPSALKK